MSVGILHKGGTVLHTARFPEFKELSIQKNALRSLNQNQIDALIVIGGNGSLTGALALHNLHFPVVGVPATIDNDVWGSDMAIGVDTAINTILDSIDKLRDTASSHERAFLIETMGRHNGYLALMGGITGGAEVIIIPEIEIRLEEVAERVEQSYIRGKTKGKRQKAKGKRQKAKGKRQKAKGKRQKAKGKRQKAKGKRQKARLRFLRRGKRQGFASCGEAKGKR